MGVDQGAQHGFDLDDRDRRLLRGRPPADALAWAVAALGPRARLRSVRALAGGTSSAVHGLAIEEADGRLARVVLRRFVRVEWLAEEPDVAAREARALELLEASSTPAPRLLAVDPSGAEAGEPAVLMTRLAGHVDWEPRHREPYLRRMAELLPLIHATPLPAAHGLPDYETYGVRLERAPRWAARPRVWLRALELVAGPAPAGERSFIHRDYHPGNVLWTASRVSGVVDWVNASLGSPDADVGHCRLNLAIAFDAQTADQFSRLHRSASGRRIQYDPYWDIAAAVGGLGPEVDERPAPAVEAFLARAVSRL
jgi:aminoglycoside phosphotransferase (APT) family kinase protein